MYRVRTEDEIPSSRLCLSCLIEKSLDDFGNHGKGLYGKQSTCKDCYNANMRAISKVYYIKVAEIKIERGCVDCGYNKHPEALDFDHKPEYSKNFNISKAVHKNWELVLEEMTKCDVVCANCHRIRTFHRRNKNENIYR